MKKRVLISALLFMLIILLPLNCMAETYYVSTANHKVLNMRVSPSVYDDILCFIPYGARVNVISFIESDYWAYVSYNSMYGYVMTRYLSRSNPSSGSGTITPGYEPSADLYSQFYTTSYYAYVVPSTPTSYVNIRWAPSKTAPVQCVRYSGEQLLVIAQNGTWCQVYDENSQSCGFMMSSFLRSY